MAKENERLEKQQREKERQNLRRKSCRKVKVTQSSPVKLVVPIPSRLGSSTESGDSTESTDSTEPMCE